MPSTTRKLHLVEQAASNGEKRAVLVALRERLAVRIVGIGHGHAIAHTQTEENHN